MYFGNYVDYKRSFYMYEQIWKIIFVFQKINIIHIYFRTSVDAFDIILRECGCETEKNSILKICNLMKICTLALPSLAEY